MKCFNCGVEGHMAAYCPLLVPAQDDDEHMARIAAIIARWVDGEISTEAKRRSIGAENMLRYGENCPKHLLYP